MGMSARYTVPESHRRQAKQSWPQRRDLLPKDREHDFQKIPVKSSPQRSHERNLNLGASQDTHIEGVYRRLSHFWLEMVKPFIYVPNMEYV